MNSHSHFNYIIRDKHVRLQYLPSMLNSSSSSASSTGTSPFYGSETPPAANTASSSHSSSLQPFLTSTSCVCPPGFKQNQGGPQQGCVRKTELTNSIKFLKLDYVNYTSTNMESMDARNFTICESTWRANSRCLGFGYEYDGVGFCSMVLGELRHGYWSPGTEASLFLKVDRSETDASKLNGMIEVLQTSCLVRISFPLPPKGSNSTARNIAIICKLFAAKLISGVAFFWSFIKRYIKYRDMATTLGLEFLPAGGPKWFSYAELKTTTKDFSNLIGRGGFGDVYKGQLPDYRVVAVKWLKNVTGSHREFWAEVTVQKLMEDHIEIC